MRNSSSWSKWASNISLWYIEPNCYIQHNKLLQKIGKVCLTNHADAFTQRTACITIIIEIRSHFVNIVRAEHEVPIQFIFKDYIQTQSRQIAEKLFNNLLMQVFHTSAYTHERNEKLQSSKLNTQNIKPRRKKCALMDLMMIIINSKQ